jgi:hypothetical protein
VLFDLRGKRKRVVQVSYAALAVLFVVGFLGFGIGVGGGLGGIFDALGISNNSNTGSASSQFQGQIDAAHAKLQKNPNDTSALLKLADNEYLLGKEGVSQDPSTGQISVSNDAHTAFGEAADAWSKYLRVNKGKPDVTTAANMINVYLVLNDASGAARAQEILAKDQPSAQSYGQLAYFQYYAGDITAGDASRNKAESLASGSQRKQLESTLKSARKTGLKIQKAEQAAKKKNGGGTATTPGSNPLQNPFGTAPGSTTPVSP